MPTPRLPTVALLVLLALSPELHAQNRALELAAERNADLPPSVRENLETIGRYAETVNRRLAPKEARPRRLDQVADPFEVSPQLRDGPKNSSSPGGLPNAGRLELQRQVQLRALLAIGGRRVAQLVIRDKDSLTVHDRELIDLGELGVFEVRIERDAVSLFNPSAPQGSKLILR